MITKICSSCGLEKLEIFFRKEKYKKQCKQCLNDKSKEYNKNHKNIIKEYSKLYQRGTQRKKYLTQYYKLNKDKMKIVQKEYENKKYHSDPAYRLRRIISAAVSKSLRRKNLSKNKTSFVKNISYSMQDLKNHLENKFEPWMNWGNHGKFSPKTWDDNNQSTWTWQIDHIKPHSTFNYSSMEDDEFKKCWALENLRPLSSKINIVEGTNKIRHIGRTTLPC